jgi:hypothetical protein
LNESEAFQRIIEAAKALADSQHSIIRIWAAWVEMTAYEYLRFSKQMEARDVDSSGS